MLQPKAKRRPQTAEKRTSLNRKVGGDLYEQAAKLTKQFTPCAFIALLNPYIATILGVVLGMFLATRRIA